MTPTVETDAAAEEELELLDEAAQYYADPLGFVLWAWPWGEAGSPLEKELGPDDLQKEFLNAVGKEVAARGFDGTAPVMPIRMSETSGHGTGKSAMGAWLAWWILSTRPNSMGTVTAGTMSQLETKTWAAFRTWGETCITRDWFDIQATGIYHKHERSSWNVVAQTCREENAQSFAGQHARTSTSWYLFDEASTVPDGVWTVAYGGLTDGSPMFFAWGQPERNTGEFYNINFGKQAARWNTRTVDSRDSRFTNKEYIHELLADYGEDSDTFRVRVLGLPPRASELQYIDWIRVRDAQTRQVVAYADEPLVLGVDCSDGGAAWNVGRFRRGFDGRSIPPIRISGEATRNDPHILTAALAEALRDPRPERRVAACFIDAAFGAAIAERLRTMGFHQVQTVRFGAASTDKDCLNWRAAMYKAAKDWLLLGAIPTETDDRYLSVDLTGPGYHLNEARKLVIESKEQMRKRKVKSPDDGDAFVLTFAAPVARVAAPPLPPRPSRGPHAWMG